MTKKECDPLKIALYCAVVDKMMEGLGKDVCHACMTQATMQVLKRNLKDHYDTDEETFLFIVKSTGHIFGIETEMIDAGKIN